MATGPTYIPPRDGDFNTWLENFSVYINVNYSALGVSPSDASTIAAMTAAWDTAYTAAIAGSTRGPMTVAAKDTARANAQYFARLLAININNNPSITNDQKVALGITVRKTTKTPVPTPTTSPILTFIAATPLQHTLRFADQLTPASRARPFGATALELRVFVGIVPPTPESLATYVLTGTKNPLPVNFDNGMQGKSAYYLGFWRTQTALYGPASTVLQSVIV